jgi:hypothetical protein
VQRCVVVDVETGEGYLSFVPLGLSEYKGGCICYFSGKVYYLHRNGALPETEEYKFFIKGQRFGNDKLKRLETIEIEGDAHGEVQMIIMTEKQAKTITLNLGVGEKYARVGLQGKAFDFLIFPSKGVTMYAMTVELSRIGAVK